MNCIVVLGSGCYCFLFNFYWEGNWNLVRLRDLVRFVEVVGLFKIGIIFVSIKVDVLGVMLFFILKYFVGVI